ncbi:S8 family serine peptidase [Haloterrigena alkaliphila]|uniref:S8 family serine peptidase n=1 Tax=Haloterrigena alkaliphila TaxID=2816475 RepID=UPI001CFFDB3D|nr:S8 family serine peptidase [Haloterrigena alkaliphila]QSX00149.2 S8 family serine peptidase [Haloterrigena alkaliphila]
MVLLCTSLLFPAAVAVEHSTLASPTASDETNRDVAAGSTTADSIAVERSERAQIDPALEDLEGVAEVIVRFENDATGTASTDDTDTRSLQTTANRSQTPFERAAETTAGLEVERQFWLANAALARVDTDRVDLDTVAAIDGVVEIHADVVVELETAATTAGPTNGTAGPRLESTATTSAPVGSIADGSSAVASPGATTTRFGDPYTYGLEQLSVPDVHETYDARGDGATVAVLDTGADDSHPDVRVDAWRDFSGGSSTPMDYNGHGTHVAGTIAGGDASGTQIGVAPEAELLVGAVLTDCSGDTCVGRTSDVIAGIEWAVKKGADVISLSLGSERYTASYISAIRNAEASGTVVVAGAGNGGSGVSASPANVYDAISVGATDEYERVSDFSSGEEVDTAAAWGSNAPPEWPGSYIVPTVVAPGDRILSATAGGGYERKRGTSMATPHVAGVIALLQGATDRSLEPDESREAVTKTATKPAGNPDEQDIRYGHGIVDAVAALEEAGSFATVEGTVSDTVTGAPIENATLVLESGDDIEYEVTPNAEGKYELERVPAERKYTLTATAPGYETTNESSFVPADETATLDVSLEGDSGLEVALQDAQFEAGVADATVEATGERGTYPGTHRGDGEYSIDALPGGSEYTINVTAEGYVDETVPVGEITGTGSHRVVLEGDATLSVAVVDEDGDPISNATATIERPDGTSFEVSGVTNADGELETTVPGTGEEYTVTIAASGYNTETVPTVISSEATASVTVELSAPEDGVPVFGTATAVLVLLAALVISVARAKPRSISASSIRPPACRVSRFLVGFAPGGRSRYLR